MAVSLGQGLLVREAVRLQERKTPLTEAVSALIAKRECLCQLVLVDDLLYLHRSGRVSGGKALVGTALGIKPLLKGDNAGKLVVCGKVRGWKKGRRMLADRYEALVEEPQKQTAAIVHTDCTEKAEYLAVLIREKRPPRDILFSCYEPVTGSHLGPGAVALFFFGAPGVRAY